MHRLIACMVHALQHRGRKLSGSPASTNANVATETLGKLLLCEASPRLIEIATERDGVWSADCKNVDA